MRLETYKITGLATFAVVAVMCGCGGNDQASTRATAPTPRPPGAIRQARDECARPGLGALEPTSRACRDLARRDGDAVATPADVAVIRLPRSKCSKTGNRLERKYCFRVNIAPRFDSSVVGRAVVTAIAQRKTCQIMGPDAQSFPGCRTTRKRTSR